jgi:dTDP-4-amino-4,6-dideoxygalactose transaminase
VIPHGSIFIDLSAKDAAFAMASSLRQWDHNSLKRRVAELWTSLSRTEAYPHAHNVLVTLSVRSALDLYLTSCQFPRGSLVLMGAINIPDISVVFRAHGLVPVPVDVDTETLAIRPALLEAALARYGAWPRGQPVSLAADASPPRVALVFTAHLFGRVTDVTPLVAICRRHAVPFVEDLAEALVDRSPVCFGHPDADLTLHSFGATKVRPPPAHLPDSPILCRPSLIKHLLLCNAIP